MTHWFNRFNPTRPVAVDLGKTQLRAIDLVNNQVKTQPVDNASYLNYGALVQPAHLKLEMKRLFALIDNAKFLLQPTIVTAGATHLTQAEHLVLKEGLKQCGVGKVLIFPNALALALGAGLSLRRGSGGLLLHLGEGLAEASVVNTGEVVYAQSTFFAGSWLNYQLTNIIRKKHDAVVSDHTLNKIKTKLLSYYQQRSLIVSAKRISTGQVVRLKLTTVDFKPALADLADHYRQLVLALLKQAPADMVIDLTDQGLVLTGGLALIDGLSLYLTETLDFPVVLAENARLALVLGLAKLARDLDQLKALAINN